MLAHYKRILLFFASACMALLLSAQVDDISMCSQRDSLQDLQLELLTQQVKSMKDLLKNSTQQQLQLSDSLIMDNNEQARQIVRLNRESEILKENLSNALEEIESSNIKLKENRRKFKTVFLVAIPALLSLIVAAFMVLYFIISRYQNNTEAKVNALRKYTYEGIEEVRADYVSEIKRRVKKLAGKFRGKKEIVKSKK